MGRTIPSFRITLAMEKEEWKPFMLVLAAYESYHNNGCMCAYSIAFFFYDHYQYVNIYYTTRNLPIASTVAFAFDKMVCASGINTELAYAGVPDVEAIALVRGTYPSPP
jgi:hypothetical protein